MMPASNNGVGMNVGFPDVCLTPPPPPVGPIPIPYPNMALNAQSAVFSPNIFTGFMPALNMASIKPMTLGDNAGVLHPLFMQVGGQTMGNPIVFVNCIPAKNLLVPTYGNAFNNPIGVTAVPSVTVTLYTDREVDRSRAQPASLELLRALRDAVAGDDVDAYDVDKTRVVRIGRFTSDVGTRFFRAMRGFSGERVIIDLRHNPGGDARACLDLLDDWIAPGTIMALLVEGDDETPCIARAEPLYPWPLTVLVDGGTASAAELFAGSLQAVGRAVIAGEPTAGKGSAQRLCPLPDGGFAYRTVAEYRLPDGRRIHGQPIVPSGSSSHTEGFAT